MTGGWSRCCPCFGSRSSVDRDGDGAADRDPVVLVSGMGGSILHSKNKKSGFESRVWVRIWLADLQFRKKLWSIYNPLTGYTEELDDTCEIIVPDDDFGLYAIDILDPSLFVKLMHLTDVYHFHDMVDMLVGCGYKKGTTLFGFGYDFRQSNRIDKSMEGLKVKLETAHKASGGRKVNIISHSMGGLLVSCFLSLYPDIFSKYVNKWICIACPFQGAPGCINDSLLTGLQFVEGFESYFFVLRWTMHQLVVECPSIYEMMPNPGYDWKEQPLIQIWRKKQTEEQAPSVKLETYGPHESSTVFEEALRNNELSYQGKTVALPFNFAIFKWATATRQVLNNAQLPEGVTFYNIYGTSFDTPFHVCFGSETSPIVDLSELCHTMPEYSFVDGDETVPTESAKADGYAAAVRVGIPARHRELLRDERVFELIKQWLGLGLGVTSKVAKLQNSSKVMDVVSS
ncbi:Phospholipase A(1) lcat3 [Dionaea muscipula]